MLPRVALGERAQQTSTIALLAFDAPMPSAVCFPTSRRYDAVPEIRLLTVLSPVFGGSPPDGPSSPNYMANKG